MSHRRYITPEEYEEAARYGIKARLLDVRVRDLEWDKDRAIHTPPRSSKRLPKQWVALAQKNGIGYQTFRSRVCLYGWDYERAATQPPMNSLEISKAALERRRKYPAEMQQLAVTNGICVGSFRRRMRAGWNPLEAATQPLLVQKKKYV